MKEITIDIDKTKSPKEIYDKLNKEAPKKGDHLKLFSSEESRQGFLLFVLVIILLTLSRSIKSYGDIVIDKIFGNYKSEKDLEEEIEREYGIKVTVETKKDSERKDWMRMSAIEFEKGYSDPDDDYSDVPVREPNPDYIPWKKGI
jgi:hypothetical protein